MDTNPQEFRKLIEIVGFLSLIASLIFVALEIRQNTNAVRGATIQGFAEHSMEVSMVLAQNADIRAAWLVMDDKDLDADQELILQAMYIGLMRLLENRLIQAEIGVIDFEDLERFGAKASVYRTSYFRRFWALTKDQYSIQFQEYVEREILSQSLLP